MQYLTRPRDELLSRQEKSEKIHITLDDYQKETNGIGNIHKEIQLYQLAQGENYNLGVIQKQDRILLRYMSQVKSPWDLKIDGKIENMHQEKPGIYEKNLSYIDPLKKRIEIDITIGSAARRFHLHLLRQHKPEV